MKNSYNVKAFALLLAFAIPALASCGGGGAVSDESDSPRGETVASGASATADERVYPTLPDVAYDGYTFNFVQWEQVSYGEMTDDIYSDGSAGTRLDSAIYKRDQLVGEKYDIAIKSTGQQYDKIMDTYKQQVMAGDQDFDVFLVRSHEMQFVLTFGVCMDLNTLEYCDYTKPWWDKNSVKQFSIDRKLYMLMSDITLRDKDATSCVLFNKTVAADYNLGDLYALPLGDNWTWDKMIEISKGVSGDANGDGALDENDNWGMMAKDDLVYVLFGGSGGRYVTKDSDDLPVLSFGEERTLGAAQKIVDILYDESYFFHCDRMQIDTYDAPSNLFATNRFLFFIDTFTYVKQLRDMKADFGILPVPKYDETQKEYGHAVSIHFSSALSVPKTALDPARTSVILEALAAESKYTVIPEYYEVNLKEKELRDEESKAMLDIIFSTRVYDLGEFCQFGTFPSAFLRIHGSGKKDITSLYGSYEKRIQAGIDKLVETLNKNANNG